MNMQCKICNNQENNEHIIAKEMMFGLREGFSYMSCSHCGCLQLVQVPENISKYYPADEYFSFQGKTKENGTVKRFIKRTFISLYFLNIVPEWASYIKAFPFFKTLKELDINNSASILDVGCGSGRLIKQMYLCGYKHVSGIDPFIKEDIDFHGLKILKKDVRDITPKDKYDVIMLHHSFEHMEAQHETLSAIYDILSPNGYLIIGIPLCDGFAFRKYKENWFQIDAPRHFFIHSVKSMSLLAQAKGFDIENIIYDSTERQFTQSEKYSLDKESRQDNPISVKRLKSLKKQAQILNILNDGD